MLGAPRDFFMKEVEDKNRRPQPQTLVVPKSRQQVYPFRLRYVAKRRLPLPHVYWTAWYVKDRNSPLCYPISSFQQ
jgi:hypothetical protein